MGISFIIFRSAVLIAGMAGFAAENTSPQTCTLPATPKLASPYRHYSIKLTSLLAPQSQNMGLLLKVRIDGGPALQLLLDSGAQHIVLDKKAAASLGRSAGSSLELVGFGTAAKTARRVTSGTLQIGDLILTGCEMLAVNTHVLEGIDGVIPLSLFSGFLVRLDVPRRTLDLDPYPADASVQDVAYVQARADNHLLFIQAILNESQSGYVLLDTGAAYNAVSPAMAAAWVNYRILSPPVPLRASTGDTTGFLLPPGIRFRFGSHVLSADPAVVVDLSHIAAHREFAIAGVLGYPAIQRSIVTIDYRDSLVRLDGK